MTKELLLISVSGKDAPGITAALMKCIKDSSAFIEDMSQAITYGHLALSILLNISKEKSEDTLLKDLLFSAKNLGMELSFQHLENLENHKLGGHRYILNCVSKERIKSEFVSDLTQVLANSELNILKIENNLSDEFKTLEIKVKSENSSFDWDKTKEKLIGVSNRHSIDLALLEDDIWRLHRRLVVLDMDSTLVQGEVVDELARAHGVYDEVHKITEEAMNGKYDFDESLIKRVKLLKGLTRSQVEQVLKKIQLSDGAEDFIRTLKSLGLKVALISGGFNYFADHFKEKLNLDYAFSNELEFSGDTLTGKVKGSIVNKEKKAMLLEMLAQENRINLKQVVAIGDGANDLEMLAKAGLGIAFHAKDIVKKSANQNMSHGRMDSILHFLGIPGSLG